MSLIRFIRAVSTFQKIYGYERAIIEYINSLFSKEMCRDITVTSLVTPNVANIPLFICDANPGGYSLIWAI